MLNSIKMTPSQEKQLLHDVASLKRGQMLLELKVNGTKLRKKDSPKEKFQARMRRQFRKKNN